MVYGRLGLLFADSVEFKVAVGDVLGDDVAVEGGEAHGDNKLVTVAYLSGISGLRPGGEKSLFLGMPPLSARAFINLIFKRSFFADLISFNHSLLSMGDFSTSRNFLFLNSNSMAF
jgi:hypothetical protein